MLRSLSDLFLNKVVECEKLARYYRHLLLIPGSTDLPLMRAALNANPSDEALKEFARLFPDAPSLEPLQPSGRPLPATGQLRLEAIGPEEWYREIDEAIESRVASHRGGWTRCWTFVRHR